VKTFPQLRRGAFGVGLALALAACGKPNGFGIPTFGTVTGRVVDTQSMLPISGATITIGNILSVTAPSDAGGFVLRNIPVGTQELRIEALGWQRYRTSVTVTANQTTDIGVIGLPSSLTAH
jgi:hypothetical protein